MTNSRILLDRNVICLAFIAFASPTISFADDVAGKFTPLIVQAAKIVDSSVAYPGGRYEATNLLDGEAATEYSSASKGTETRIDFDLGREVPVAGFRHTDRRDPATVARARLTFSNTADFAKIAATVDVQHANTPGATTFVAFPPVTARYVRWQVTELGPKGYGTVGGAEIAWFAAGAVEPAPRQIQVHSRALDALLRDGSRSVQPLEVTVESPYAQTIDATVQVADGKPVPIRLTPGSHVVSVPPLPAVDRETPVAVTLQAGGHSVRSQLLRRPVRRWELWFLPHSHNDIGFTHVQTEVERMQWQYLDDAVDLARRTADYPEGARFKWNAEVMWAVDSYLQQATPERRDALLDAVRRGRVGLDALYGNQLTGLCRPEELFQLTECARRVAEQHDLTIDSAMISDVPGYTWGILPALAHRGVKYFSIGPNHIHRIGFTLDQWGDRPFYWVSPSGRERILCWMAGHAYSWFHPGLLGSIRGVQPQAFFSYLDQLSAQDYPFDMVQVRYSIAGDNGPPDPELPEYVRDWNERYVWPRMVIATNSQMMREFERRYGDQLPEYRGDFTPYWEDGAASSARETALARNAAERLTQAETMWALAASAQYPTDDFYSAWRNVLLYNEHTWGAHCSISQPDSPFTLNQWRIKQAFAENADRQSRELLAAAVAERSSAAAKVTAIDVYNTCSWPRDDLVLLPAETAVASDVVRTLEGAAIASQRLSDGRLAFLATEVPPLGARRFLFRPGEPEGVGDAVADERIIANRFFRIEVDDKTGAIRSLRHPAASSDVAASDGNGFGLNAYFYVAGRNPENPQPAGPATVTVLDHGPLVARLQIESDAPGCNRLIRRLQVVDRLPFVGIENVIDKQDIREKESVHFGFAANVPRGVLRLDIPWAVIRPEDDQLPGACKNYFSVGRWVDVSNEQFGLTCATIDAPLVEIGAIRVDVPKPFGLEGWVRHLEPTGTFYSYAMNNYWETNYKASQGGVTTLRYALQPHGPYNVVEATRFGIERTTPLIAAPADGQTVPRGSLLRVEPASVLVTALKPAEEGKALMLRLFNVEKQDADVRLTWPDLKPRRVTLYDPKTAGRREIGSTFSLPALGLATLQVELDR